MYITGDTIIHAAAIVTAIGVLSGVVVAVAKMVIRDRHQSETIKAMQEEQTLICYGLPGRIAGADRAGLQRPLQGRAGQAGQAPQQRGASPQGDLRPTGRKGSRYETEQQSL